MPANSSTPESGPPLRLLALETSGQAGGVAAFEGDKLVSERHLAIGQRSAQSLAPAIRDLLDELGWRPADIRVVAVTTGPGSFTGLRVGVTTAKTLAYALSAEVVGVNTLEAIVQQAMPSPTGIWAVIDAQRGELFAARFSQGSSDGWQVDIPTTIITREAWLAALRGGEQVSGPALAGLLDRLPADVVALPESSWAPTAASVGRLALQRFAAGERDDLWRLTPQYFRRSAAEEKWDRERHAEE